MIDNDPDVPVYFFDPRTRSIITGRFVRVSPGGNVIVAVETAGARWQLDHYYSNEQGTKFTNVLYEAQQDALAFFETELVDKKKELADLYKEIIEVKQAMRKEKSWFGKNTKRGE